MAKKRLTRTEMKREAQTRLMHGIGNVLGYWAEQYVPDEDMTEAERAEFLAEFQTVLQAQADRVAKILGYDAAWTN